jgi:hypothetical protein
MTISITGEPTGGYSQGKLPQLDLAIDEAKAFLAALRDRAASIVISDSRTAFQVEFTVAEDGPAFTVSKPGHQHTTRRFSLGRSYDVQVMAARLLAELGP